MRLDISYLVTGSIASAAYGEPRLTNDIDIVAAIGPQHIAPLVAAFPEPEYYIDAEMIRGAIQRQGQFKIIHPCSGFKIDAIIRGNTPFDDSRFARKRRLLPAADYQADFAAPEDVIIKKMEFYKEGGSEKHLRDITGMLRTSADPIDRGYIMNWAVRLGVSEVSEAILLRLGNQA